MTHPIEKNMKLNPDAPYKEDNGGMDWSILTPPLFRFIENIKKLWGIPSTQELNFVNYEDLHLAHEKGPRILQEVKYLYTRNLIQRRIDAGIGPNMKTRAQFLLQNPSENGEIIALGDPSTWMIDPKDQHTALAISQLLFEDQGRTELWMGFAFNDDFVDAFGDKSTAPPLIRGIRSQDQAVQLFRLLNGEITASQVDPALVNRNTRQNSDGVVTNNLEVLENLVNKTLREKMAKRIALCQSPDYNTLLAPIKKEIFNSALEEADVYLKHIKAAELTWDEFNDIVCDSRAHPMGPDNHFLVKLFAQDNPNWKIGDIFVSKKELVVEVSQDQFTPRDAEQNPSKNVPSKITITPLEDGPTLAFVADERLLDWILPLVNDPEFWKLFDEKILPYLSDSTYQQLQYMMELPIPASELTPENNHSTLANTRIAFITDIISGLSPRNPNINEPGNGYSLTSFLRKLVNTRNNLIVLHPYCYPTAIKTTNEFLHTLRRTFNDARSGNHHKIDPYVALALHELLDYHTEKIGISLPPSAKRILASLATEKPITDHEYTRTLRILEGALKVYMTAGGVSS